MRKPKLTGIYYKEAPTLLDKQISESFEHKLGPGANPNPAKEMTEDLHGIIVPNYSYEKSGPCMAWSYLNMSSTGLPDVVIIIGQSEKGYSGITTEPYETPYGIVRVDQPLARAIIQKDNIKENNALFDEDTFVESQLPFIQYTYKKQLEKIKILPILVSIDINYREVAADIKEILMDQKKKAIIIAPTNFTHYGTNAGYIPFSTKPHEQTLELDQEAIKYIQQNDPKGYMDYVDEKAMNTNNYLGIIMAMLIIKPEHVTLEQYYTTTEIDGDDKNFTSFASIILQKHK
ncbi:AmmeMemoRadiSam system protein B [Candidatus Woesearchaeota archaeon]|nr:AmmeMemoRadiSam system protein B [Candidatus Woesearchaeota archaeon]MCF7901074.1 AmmeMemoRadiSam system protein B [Candidatus Woesearchaeota archaeon]MCF8013625.1 AmmeMemoRadiSam system protein B [Candidatus Woesearchaeota archaeon]